MTCIRNHFGLYIFHQSSGRDLWLFEAEKTTSFLPISKERGFDLLQFIIVNSIGNTNLNLQVAANTNCSK